MIAPPCVNPSESGRFFACVLRWRPGRPAFRTPGRDQKGRGAARALVLPATQTGDPGRRADDVTKKISRGRGLGAAAHDRENSSLSETRRTPFLQVGESSPFLAGSPDPRYFFSLTNIQDRVSVLHSVEVFGHTLSRMLQVHGTVRRSVTNRFCTEIGRVFLLDVPRTPPQTDARTRTGRERR